MSVSGGSSSSSSSSGGVGRFGWLWAFLVLLVLAAAAQLLALCTPSWQFVYLEDGRTEHHHGLWLDCKRDYSNEYGRPRAYYETLHRLDYLQTPFDQFFLPPLQCVFKFDYWLDDEDWYEHGYDENQIQGDAYQHLFLGWKISALAAHLFAALCLLAAVVFTICGFCHRLCVVVAAVLVVFNVLASIVGNGLFCAFANLQDNNIIKSEDGLIYEQHLGWSFWCALLGTGLAFLASLLGCVATRAAFVRRPRTLKILMDGGDDDGAQLLASSASTATTTVPPIYHPQQLQHQLATTAASGSVPGIPAGGGPVPVSSFQRRPRRGPDPMIPLKQAPGGAFPAVPGAPMRRSISTTVYRPGAGASLGASQQQLQQHRKPITRQSDYGFRQRHQQQQQRQQLNPATAGSQTFRDYYASGDEEEEEDESGEDDGRGEWDWSGTTAGAVVAGEQQQHPGAAFKRIGSMPNIGGGGRGRVPGQQQIPGTGPGQPGKGLLLTPLPAREFIPRRGPGPGPRLRSFADLSGTTAAARDDPRTGTGAVQNGDQFLYEYVDDDGRSTVHGGGGDGQGPREFPGSKNTGKKRYDRVPFGLTSTSTLTTRVTGAPHHQYPLAPQDEYYLEPREGQHWGPIRGRSSTSPEAPSSSGSPDAAAATITAASTAFGMFGHSGGIGQHGTGSIITSAHRQAPPRPTRRPPPSPAALRSAGLLQQELKERLESSSSTRFDSSSAVVVASTAPPVVLPSSSAFPSSFAAVVPSPQTPLGLLHQQHQQQQTPPPEQQPQTSALAASSSLTPFRLNTFQQHQTPTASSTNGGTPGTPGTPNTVIAAAAPGTARALAAPEGISSASAANNNWLRQLDSSHLFSAAAGSSPMMNEFEMTEGEQQQMRDRSLGRTSQQQFSTNV